jgi:hypothetical protein
VEERRKRREVIFLALIFSSRILIVAREKREREGEGKRGRGERGTIK